MHTQTSICILLDKCLLKSKHVRLCNPGLLRSYMKHCMDTHIFPCTWAGEVVYSSDLISGCLAVGQMFPMCHLAAPGYASPVSYSMSLSAVSLWSLSAHSSQRCHWVLQSTVVSSKSSDVILHFSFLQSGLWKVSSALMVTADIMQMARQDPERQLILRHADGMPGLVQLVLSDWPLKLLYLLHSSLETKQLCVFLSLF